MTKVCPICSVVFMFQPRANRERVTCSKKCVGEMYKRRSPKEHPCWKGGISEKKCKRCGILYTKKNASFCSRKCQMESLHEQRIGCKATEEAKLKQSIAMKGRSTRGSGWKHTEDYKKAKGLHHKGEKSHFWKGGLTSENKIIRNSGAFRDWRTSVFARDDWKCRKCGKRGGVLNAHHIKPFSTHPDLRLDIDNGITLCKECHTNEHHHKF